MSEEPILSVSQITNAIKHNLETTFPSIWIQGEISNCTRHSSGHVYFSLKDEKAQMSAVMFRGAASKLKVPPKDGDNVIVHGNLNVYPPSGRYQIVVDKMRLVGVGELLLKLEELKVKLHKRGWFKSEHKKPLPKFPKRIGVVTSPTGAAVQDIINVISRRFSGVHLILNPVRVQGDGSAQEIVQAINQFNEHDLVDVMIVGRGGGSIEDLWAFNEEIVAEAIFNSKIPIIAAVGHETDHCIAEYVADVRAPTPSAAAEIVIGEQVQQLKQLRQAQKRMEQTVQQLLKQSRQQLKSMLKQPVFASPYQILGPWMQTLDDTRDQIDLRVKQNIIHMRTVLEGHKKAIYSLNPMTQISHFRQKLKTYDKQVAQSWMNFLNLKNERLNNIISSLKTIDPKNLLSKGYSILFSEKDQSVINSIDKININQDIRILLSDGEALSTVKEVFAHDKREKAKR